MARGGGGVPVPDAGLGARRIHGEHADRARPLRLAAALRDGSHAALCATLDGDARDRLSKGAPWCALASASLDPRVADVADGVAPDRTRRALDSGRSGIHRARRLSLVHRRGLGRIRLHRVVRRKEACPHGRVGCRVPAPRGRWSPSRGARESTALRVHDVRDRGRHDDRGRVR